MNGRFHRTGTSPSISGFSTVKRRCTRAGLGPLDSSFVFLVCLDSIATYRTKDSLFIAVMPGLICLVLFPALMYRSLPSISPSLHAGVPRTPTWSLHPLIILNDFILYRSREMLRGSFLHPSPRQGDIGNSPLKYTPHYQKRKGKAVCLQCWIPTKALYPTYQISRKSQCYHGVRPVETFRRQSHRTILWLFIFPPGEPERAIPSGYYGPPIMSASERTISLFIVRAPLQCP